MICRFINPAEIQNELKSSCPPPQTNRLLFDLVGVDTLSMLIEEQLLTHIKQVVLKSLHKEVYHQTFHSMGQFEDESITHFLACLGTQANFYQFVVPCVNVGGYGG